MEFRNIKFIGTMVLFLLVLAPCSSQTFREWFSQKKTAKEYLAKQVVGLQLYIGYAKEGYETLRWGWNTVHQLREGEFRLHGDSFRGLARISPAVSKYERIPQFIDLQLRLVKNIKTSRKLFAAHAQIKRSERIYLDKVFDRSLSVASDLLEEMMSVAMEPGLKLNEANRLAIIDDVYLRLQELNGFVRAFNRENYQLLRHRAWEGRDTKTIQSLYQLHTP
ncbi:hypothetical protein KZP23_17190 [Echinicola marina]|uniref:hypothetical protein n=1 Tax=Echinicola marina TaxID=2859768 RepID=UPI001CF71437|nr:hypothetical protein [Echinicola marina]UCS92418.1 hypothetical protein KZP23_17190 [Echinicola marina]